MSDAAAPLTPFERSTYSQNGEDGVIAEILGRIGAPSRWFVEFGIEDGSQGNCVALAYNGWAGLFIECDDDNYAILADRWRDRPDLCTLHAAVTPDTVNALFAEAGVPAEPDLLSIDVDGNDYWIWAAVEGYRPRVVVVEYNASLDPAAPVAIPHDDDHCWDGTDFFGASVGALRFPAAQKGYRLVHTDSVGVNAFFVRADLAAPFPGEQLVPLHPPAYGAAGGGHRRDPRARSSSTCAVASGSPPRVAERG